MNKKISTSQLNNLAVLTFFTLLSVCSHSGKVILKNDFVGNWWTDSATLPSKNHKLIVQNDFSVSWIILENDGRESVLNASSDQVKVIDNFMYITFLSRENKALIKMILGGWKSQSDSKIFGTLYLFPNEQELINGIPVKFNKGEGHFLPPKVREIFSNKIDGIKVDREFLLKSINQLKKMALNSVTDTPLISSLYSEKPFFKVIYTKHGHEAHPALFIAVQDKSSMDLKLSYKTAFSGDEKKALDFYIEYKQLISEEVMDHKEIQEEIVKINHNEPDKKGSPNNTTKKLIF